MISDLGLCWNNAFVLAYVASEVLRGCPYTRAADVYSVGYRVEMIMYELWSGRPPFDGRKYDDSPTFDICSGNMSFTMFVLYDLEQQTTSFANFFT